MQIHKYGLVCRLREPIGHRDDRRLLQTEYIFEIARKILQERLFSGPQVSENGRQSEPAQEVVRRIVNGHLTFGLVALGHISYALMRGRRARSRLASDTSIPAGFRHFGRDGFIRSSWSCLFIFCLFCLSHLSLSSRRRIRHPTSRSLLAQKRSRRPLLSILPEPSFGSSASEN